MKKLIGLMLLMSGVAGAVDPYSVNRSSYISGATQTACIQANYLDKVLTGATSSAGFIVIFNSSWTISAPVVSSISLTAGNMQDFANTRVAGICYQASAANGVTVIYKN